jgi:hypothetical protein
MRDSSGSHCGDAFYQGTTSQAGEKLGFKVGRGFISGMNIIKSMWALAPEVCFSPDPEFFRSLFSRAVEAREKSGH